MSRRSVDGPRRCATGDQALTHFLLLFLLELLLLHFCCLAGWRRFQHCRYGGRSRAAAALVAVGGDARSATRRGSSEKKKVKIKQEKRVETRGAKSGGAPALFSFLLHTCSGGAASAVGSAQFYAGFLGGRVRSGQGNKV